MSTINANQVLVKKSAQSLNGIEIFNLKIYDSISKMTTI